MNSEPKQSSAARLLRLIQRGAIVHGNTQALEAVAMMLGVDPTDHGAVFSGVGSLYQLIETARSEVKSNPELNQQLFLGALDAIGNVVRSINYSTTWEGYRLQFVGGNVIALEFVAEQFDRLTDEIAIKAEEIDALGRLLNEAIAEIASSSVERELKLVLVARLEDARRALLRYQIDGVDGIKRAAEAAIGALVLVGETAKAPSSKAGIERFLEVTTKIVDLVNKARPIAKLLKPVFQRLLASGETTLHE